MDTLFNLLKDNPETVIAFVAIIISIISLRNSQKALQIQQKHNILSVRPIPEVTHADYDDSLQIKLRNNGVGPLIVKALVVTDRETRNEALIDWMPQLYGDRAWNYFSRSIKNRAFLPDGEIVLLELTKYEGERDFSKSRDPVRKALSKLTIEVLYTDVYGSKFVIYTKSLDWFGRHRLDV